MLTLKEYCECFDHLLAAANHVAAVEHRLRHTDDKSVHNASTMLHDALEVLVARLDHSAHLCLTSDECDALGDPMDAFTSHRDAGPTFALTCLPREE
jgi:hypothetical protein